MPSDVHNRVCICSISGNIEQQQSVVGNIASETVSKFANGGLSAVVSRQSASAETGEMILNREQFDIAKGKPAMITSSVKMAEQSHNDQYLLFKDSKITCNYRT